MRVLAALLVLTGALFVRCDDEQCAGSANQVPSDEVYSALFDFGSSGSMERLMHSALRTLARTGGQLGSLKTLIGAGTASQWDLDLSDSEGRSLVYLAADNGHTDTVRVLAELGASVTKKADNGEAPVHRAARGGHVGVLRALVRHGASLAARDDEDGRTAAHYAADDGHVKVIRYLAARDVDLEARDNDGWTAAHYAAANLDAAMLRALDANGADLCQTTDIGDIPAGVAAHAGDDVAVMRVLFEHAKAHGSITTCIFNTGAVVGDRPRGIAETEGHTKIVKEIDKLEKAVIKESMISFFLYVLAGLAAFGVFKAGPLLSRAWRSVVQSAAVPSHEAVVAHGDGWMDETGPTPRKKAKPKRQKKKLALPAMARHGGRDDDAPSVETAERPLSPVDDTAPVVMADVVPSPAGMDQSWPTESKAADGPVAAPPPTLGPECKRVVTMLQALFGDDLDKYRLYAAEMARERIDDEVVDDLTLDDMAEFCLLGNRADAVLAVAWLAEPVSPSEKQLHSDDPADSGPRTTSGEEHAAAAVSVPTAAGEERTAAVPDVADVGARVSVYVGNLAWNVSKQDLQEHFNQVGCVSKAYVLLGSDGRSRGCGIVVFESTHDASNAIASLNESAFHGRLMYVRWDLKAEPTSAVYVGNLAWNVSWIDLKVYMRKAGRVARADVIKDRSGRSCGYGIVEFETARGASKAISMLTETELNGRRIFVRSNEIGGVRSTQSGGVRSNESGGDAIQPQSHRSGDNRESVAKPACFGPAYERVDTMLRSLFGGDADKYRLHASACVKCLVNDDVLSELESLEKSELEIVLSDVFGDVADAALAAEWLKPEKLAPLHLLCPITLEVMRDAVIIDDGRAYERAAIEAHFARNGLKSPVTGAAVSAKTTTAWFLRGEADAWHRRVVERP